MAQTRAQAAAAKKVVKSAKASGRLSATQAAIITKGLSALPPSKKKASSTRSAVAGKAAPKKRVARKPKFARRSKTGERVKRIVKRRKGVRKPKAAPKRGPCVVPISATSAVKRLKSMIARKAHQ